MILQAHECEQLYRIWWPLLSYVSQRGKHITSEPIEPNVGAIAEKVDRTEVINCSCCQ